MKFLFTISISATVVLAMLTMSRSRAETFVGTAAVDISPQVLPVIRNGSFLEAQADRILDPLHARCMVIRDAETKLAIIVADSCMIPREVCDLAKAQIKAECGIREDRILIAATHCHSAPSVMDYCLGSRADAEYTAFLPGKLVQAVVTAEANMQPARIGWTSVNLKDHTHCRRWITRPDKMQEDPFGKTTVRAMMHPGHQNPDYICPSGPADPALSILSAQTLDGEPLALMANYSMHYFQGHAGISADYFGRFSKKMEERLSKTGSGFVAMMSQGTSGDLWWGDYRRKERRDWTMEQYSEDLADAALQAYRTIEHQSDLGLAMAEQRLVLNRRLPDSERLAWAEELLNQTQGGQPVNRPEVYARQAFYLRDHPSEEIVLQALRIGDLSVTAIPCEVYALTGLKLKAASPSAMTFNISLANGASGYIPPPEQHLFGGYTTWPARTAGLETEAEPKIVTEVTGLLEKVNGKPAKSYAEPPSPYSNAVLQSQPLAYWRLGEMNGSTAKNSAQSNHHGTYKGRAAYHLDGIPKSSEDPTDTGRAVYFAGGNMEAQFPALRAAWTLECWFWSGLSGESWPLSRFLMQLGPYRIQISGSNALAPGRVQLDSHLGHTTIREKTWHHLALVGTPDGIRILVNGKLDLETSADESNLEIRSLVLGHDGMETNSPFDGKMDEVALFNRTLSDSEIISHLETVQDP